MEEQPQHQGSVGALLFLSLCIVFLSAAAYVFAKFIVLYTQQPQ